MNEVEESTGWTPLHAAASRGVLETAQILLQSGADINAVHPNTLQTPLHIAITFDRNTEETMALYLIQEGADLERRDAWSKTALIAAANCKRMRTISALINSKADIHGTNIFCRSILQSLVQKGSVMAFADLIQRGVDLHRRDLVGCSPFHEATGDTSFISLLLNSNVHLEDSSLFSCIHTLSTSQMAWLTSVYPLFRKRYGFRALRKFANLAPTDSQAPLCEVAKLGSVLAMENLLELGAPIDLDGCHSGSALMAACEFGRKGSVKYLVRRGAALSYTGSNGFGSAYYSAKGHQEI